MKNLAAFVLENRKIEVLETDMPLCRPGYVNIKVEYCGICGSDVHFYSHGEPAFPDVYPFILGHECAGEVVELGEGVTDLRVGDRVAVEPGITCGKCEWCKSGKYNLCPNVKFLSAPTYHGAMRQYITHPSDLCFKLPENVSCIEGALIEPLAVGLNSVKESAIQMGSSAVVLGAGAIGLMTLISLKAMGITDITVCDLYDIRLNKAIELGATRVINSSDVDSTKLIMELTNDRGVDYVFETAGSRHTVAQSINIVKRGGTIMIIGNVVGETPFDFQKLVDKEVTILSNFRYRNIYPVAIDAIASGRINVKDIVSWIYPLKDTMKGFEDCINDKQGIVKAVVRVGE